MNTPVSFEISLLLKEKGFDEQWNIHMYMPTISDVCMWLYEKYRIWIHCEICFDGAKFISKITKVIENLYPYNTQFNSPTEAYLSAIKYTLENLI